MAASRAFSAPLKKELQAQGRTVAFAVLQGITGDGPLLPQTTLLLARLAK